MVRVGRRSRPGWARTSAYTWLKLPVVDGHGRGDGRDHAADPAARRRPGRSTRSETYATWEKALALPGVRGLVVGRTLLYPPDGDVAGAVDRAAGMVRGVTVSAGSRS